MLPTASERPMTRKPVEDPKHYVLATIDTVLKTMAPDQWVRKGGSGTTKR